MRKGILTIMTVLCLAGLAGCAKNKQGEQQGEATKAATAGKKDLQFVSEDFEQGNRPGNKGNAMLRTENGFYHYNDTLGGFRYYDNATGKELFLCNKPECRHDGNEFCVATNEKYRVLDYDLYGEHLMVFAAEVTDTQFLYKVLVLALDGSSMNEVATVLELERTPDMSLYTSRMYLHRNKALLTFTTGASYELEDTMYYGTALFDLNTKNVTFFDEEPMGKENVETTDITAYGNYFYYCRKKGKKIVLHRRHIENGTDETCRLLVNFSGQYAVLEEDYIVYLRGEKKALCTYHFSTGENEEKVMLFEKVPWYDVAGNLLYETEEGVPAVGLVTDGTYLYVPQATIHFDVPYPDGRVEEYTKSESAYIRVFNKGLEEVTVLNLAEQLPLKEEYDCSAEESFSIRTTHNLGFRYLGEDIYWCPVYVPDQQTVENHVYHCKRSDLLNGEPEFSFLYGYSEW
ncbi:MAG: hypothetical protein IJZ55_08555 [Lachnospiraceae bacterium]|nr:hypothetical protein [Lachnospiraceae bacterium]